MALTLKAARINKGLTQREAAQALGISDASLRSYEKGKTFPKISIIQKMEELYGVTYSELIFLPNSTI